MTPPDDPDRLLEMLLAGTPSRLLDVAAGGDPEAIATLDAARETLGSLGLALDPVAPSPAVRERLAAAVAAAPRGRRRAVVVIDMQLDHLTPGRPLEVPRAREIVPAVRAQLDAARGAHEPVVYLCDRHEPGDQELAVWSAHNVAGTPGAEVWPEIAPQPGDHVITHRSYSGFFETDLAALLGRLQVDTLVLTGCLTEVHLYATAVDALMRGYHVEVPPACQAGSSAVSEQVVLGTLAVLRPLERIAPK